MSRPSGLETRRLHALAREELVDRFAVDAQHAADSDGVEASVMNQAANRFGVDAELTGDVPDTHQALGLSFRRRHATPETYNRNRRIAASRITLDLAAVVGAVRPEAEQRRQQGGCDQDREDREIDQAGFRHVHTSFPGLEANVLECVGGLSVEPCRRPVVAALGCEIAERDPGGGAMARG